MSQQAQCNPPMPQMGDGIAIHTSNRAARIVHFVALLTLPLLLAACGNRPAHPPWRGEVQMIAPATIDAGEPTAVLVLARGAPDGPISLVAHAAYGPQVLHGELNHGSAAFALDSALTAQAGALPLTVLVGASRAATTMMVLPGPTVQLSEPILGPRSICAATNGTVAAVLAADRYGNAPTDGLVLRLRADYPDGATAVHDAQIRGGIAWTEVASNLVAGSVGLRGAMGSVVGPTSVFDVHACEARPFSLRADPRSAPADGRRVLILSTATIRDVYGNVMPDGSSVLFLVRSDAGEARLPAITINGVAEVTMRALTQPGTVEVRAVIGDRLSGPLSIHFGAAP